MKHRQHVLTHIIAFVFFLPTIIRAEYSRSDSEYLYMGKSGEPVIEMTRKRLDDGSVLGSFSTLNTPKEFLPIEGSNNTLPDFLASPNHGHRIVVFYSPWCG